MWGKHLGIISERLKRCFISLDVDIPYFVYECGVFRGESATVLAKVIHENRGGNIKLALFDTFEGMPEVNTSYDNKHKKGDFSNTSQGLVSDLFVGYNFIEYYKGIIPATFEGRENDKICFAHLDLDIYQSYKDCLEFIFPRLIDGGVIMCHDYNYDSCLGAQKAINDFIDRRDDMKLETYDCSCIIVKK